MATGNGKKKKKANGHGGKRAGAGRPPGSTTARLRGHYKRVTELCAEDLEGYVAELRKIAFGGGRASDRMRAIQLLLAYAAGQPRQSVDLDAKVDSDGVVVVRGYGTPTKESKDLLESKGSGGASE